MFLNTNQGGIVVARDDQGELLTGLCEKIQQVQNTAEVEAAKQRNQICFGNWAARGGI
jgi:hypothetical protein